MRSSNVTMRRLMTTKGWQLCIQWKYLLSTWVDLNDMKYSYPIKIVKYVVNNGISDEPAFACCLPYKTKKEESNHLQIDIKILVENT